MIVLGALLLLIAVVIIGVATYKGGVDATIQMNNSDNAEE